MEEMAMPRGNFDAAESAALETPCRVRELVDHALDFFRAQDVRNRPADVIGKRRCPHGRRILAGRVTTAARVLHLPEQPAILRLDGLGPALETFDVVVIPHANLV